LEAPGYTAPNFNNSQVGAAFIVLGNKTLAAPGHSMIDLTDPNTFVARSCAEMEAAS